MIFLTRPARKRKRTSARREPRRRHDDISDDGVDEAAALIAETTQTLARLARRHNLEMLDYLLRMTHLEAEEWLRLRSRRKLS